MLARAPHLAADIAYFLHTTDWQSHPIFLELQVSTPTPLSDYVSRIRNLSASDASAPLLLAHAYVRYLGDLSGGQFIKRRLMKVYDLPETGEGVRFYEFEGASGDGSKASRPEMKRVKDWYRSGMDSGVGEDEKLKGKSISQPRQARFPQFLTTGFTAALVEEAVHVFHLNQALFTAIRGPVQQPLSPITEAPPTPNTLVSPASARHSLSTSKPTCPLSPSPIASLPPTVRPWIIMAVSVGFTVWWFGSWSPYLNPQLMHTRGPSVA